MEVPQPSMVHHPRGCVQVLRVKMLTLNVDYLYADARIIVQSVSYQMLQRQKDELAAVDYEDMAEAAYAATATPA